MSDVRIDSHETDSRKNRKYSVSANRDRSHHRLCYVETGGATVDAGECVFCEVTPTIKTGDEVWPGSP